MEKSLKHLGFDSLRQGMSEQTSKFPDQRVAEQVDYSIHDVVMSAFACMYFQEPSLLDFQMKMREGGHLDNLSTMFGVEKIPEATQLRGVLDRVDPGCFRDIFSNFFLRLQRGKHLEQYQFLPGKYLVSIDGTQFSCSSKINCEHCMKAEHSSGKVTFSHKAVQAALMHPELKPVIPLMPEEIANSDGQIKQDCEINASKRLLKKLRQDHPQLGIIILGDGLFSKQPFIEELAMRRMDYVLVAKPDDHTAMMDWIKVSKIKQQRVQVAANKVELYEWINNVPLSAREDAIWVNFFRCTKFEIDPENNEIEKGTDSWVTNLTVSAENVAALTKAGRCRWKIENECFNTLKNQGYHLEHNYGHGKEHLGFNFYLLTLLAFLVHQILELTDELYQQCRKKLGSKKSLWHTLTSCINMLLFDSWRALLQFVLNPRAFSTQRFCQISP
jgi:hypothetical protein